MAKKEHSLKSRYEDYLYDRPRLKSTLSWSWAIFLTAISSLVFAIGYKIFLNPTGYTSTSDLQRIVAGGCSGISMTFEVLISMISGGGSDEYSDLIYSLFYLVINIPMLILAFKVIGKRFAILSVINVVLASVLVNLLGLFPEDNVFEAIASFVSDNGGLLARAFFAGVCTGLSSAIAYKIDSSAGGMDIVAYAIALKKSTSAGKYTALINGLIIIVYTIISGISYAEGATAIALALFSVVYLIVAALVIDLINVRNKKCEITIVTAIPDLANIIMAQIPHGATITQGKGAFTESDKTIITMVVSTYEVNQTVSIIKEADPNSFIKVTDLKQVYGHFFLPPIK